MIPSRHQQRIEFSVHTAENAVLRHQLIVLRRKLRGRVQFANSDRWFFIQLYRWFPSILQVLTIIRPRRSSTGTGLAFAAICAGSHDLWEAGRRSRRGCARRGEVCRPACRCRLDALEAVRRAEHPLSRRQGWYVRDRTRFNSQFVPASSMVPPSPSIIGFHR